MLFPENIGSPPGIDEVAVTHGEFWTVLTNKAKHGRKGALIAMIQGVKASDVAEVCNENDTLYRETPSPR